MRRILHSVLVLLVVAALVAPLSADAEAARTPICCQGKGEHDCLGDMHSPAGAAPQGFSSGSDKCPYSPLALAPNPYRAGARQSLKWADRRRLGVRRSHLCER